MIRDDVAAIRVDHASSPMNATQGPRAARIDTPEPCAQPAAPGGATGAPGFTRIDQRRRTPRLLHDELTERAHRQPPVVRHPIAAYPRLPGERADAAGHARLTGSRLTVDVIARARDGYTILIDDEVALADAG